MHAWAEVATNSSCNNHCHVVFSDIVVFLYIFLGCCCLSLTSHCFFSLWGIIVESCSKRSKAPLMKVNLLGSYLAHRHQFQVLHSQIGHM